IACLSREQVRALGGTLPVALHGRRGCVRGRLAGVRRHAAGGFHSRKINSPFGATVHMSSSIEATSSESQVTVDDLGTEEAFLAAIDETIKYFNDGDIVEGTVVKVDRDEVLLDIGYKTEGVIPSRELSIKHDV